MDIIYRLRILFWFLIVLIWGVYLYQYISEDMKESQKNKIILTKEKKQTYNLKTEKKNDTSYSIPQTVIITTNSHTPETKEDTPQERIMISKTQGISLPQEHYKTESEIETKPIKEKKPSLTVPEGFKFKETRHFYLYVDSKIDIEEIEKEVEMLHGEIMIDLIAFSPWTRDDKVHIYLTSTPDKYQQLSGRPAWSGGAANLREKKIYLYKSEEWFGILAHELTHIYFDSFFGGYDKSPLWLSEGVAVYVQVERAKTYPNWLKENIGYIKNGSGYNISDLIKIKSLEDADERSVKLWYAQSYSLVNFLLKVQRGDSFYQFCKRIRDGDSPSKALFNAYGKPYTTISALESIWRMDVKTGNITGVTN